MSSAVGPPKAAVADAAPPPENDSSPPLPAPLPSPETDTNPPSNTATVPTQLPASQPPLPSPAPILTLPPSPFSSLSPPPAQPLIPDPTLPPSPSLSTPPVLPPLTSPPSPPVNNSPLQLLTPPPIPLTQIPPTQSTPLTSPEQSFPVGTPPPLHAQSSPPGPAPRLPVAATPTKATPETPISSQPPISTAPSNPVNSVPPLPTLPLSQTPPPHNGGGHPAVSSHPLLLPPPPPLPTEPVPKGGSGGNGSSSNVGKIVAGSTEGSHVSTGVVVGLFLGGVIVLILLLVFSVMLIFCRKRKRSNGGSEGYSGSNYEVFEDGNLLPKQSMCNVKPYQELLKSQTVRFCSGDSVSAMVLVRSDPGIATSLSSGTFIYEDLLAATDGFSEANLLGQGGSGYVHKGILPNGKEVAVKQLKFGGQQVEREFRAEVETISLVHHKHLVSLIGYCISGADRLLVYELVPNKTLEFHLHGKEQPVMEWNTRLRIAIGSAKGLAYLHEDCNPTIIHRDIKAANILLNFNFEAKVSDFGMAKIFSPSNSSITHITTRVVGTFGYVAPEYVSSGRVTDKSDVYSFGVMLLELITGRPPISTGDSAMNGSLVSWARPLLMQAIEDRNFVTLADPRLQNNFDVNEMASMVACAAACVRLSAWSRPRMSQVVRVLEGDLSPSDLNDGIRPGQNATYFPYESSDFDPHKRYLDEMENFRIALASSRYSIGSRCSENASEYGLYPSASSTGSEQTTLRGSNRGWI